MFIEMKSQRINIDKISRYFKTATRIFIEVGPQEIVLDYTGEKECTEAMKWLDMTISNEKGMLKEKI